LQLTLQAVPLQIALPLLGFAQALQPLRVQPDATLLSATQVPVAPVPQRWKPALQARTQPVPLHETVPFGGAVQTAQLFPHDVRLVLPLTTQVSTAPAPVPVHAW
jgi:hypothetical protein